MWKKISINSKFNSKQTIIDGYKFPSTLEADFYNKLQLLKRAGEVKYFLQQVPIRLGSGIKYFVDFLIFYENGQHEYVEIKGMETSVYKMKKKMLDQMYPHIQLIVLKKGDF
jgi:hypothetical protein